MSTALKVATVVDHLVAGGAERAAVDIALHLGDDVRRLFVASRDTVVRASVAPMRPTVDQLRDGGVEPLFLGRRSTAAAWQWAPLVRRLRAERFDVLHTHSWGSNFWGPWLAAAAGVPVHVAHDQSPFARVGGVRAWGAQALVNRYVTGPRSAAIVVPSAWAKEGLVRHEGVPAGKVVVVPNAARPRDGAAPRDAVRASVGVGELDEVVVVAAMLRPEKAQDVAIEAVARLAAARPALRLVLCGGGTAQDPEGTAPALRAKAEALGVADRVVLAGRREDVHDVVAAADVALLCSDHENLPLAVLEYMEAGTPVVATDVGGVRELVVDGEHGLVVPPRDPAAMAVAIDAVLADPASAVRRAEAARARRRATFSWEVIGRDVRALYERLLQDRR